MSHHSEFKEQLVSVLAADAELTGLLASESAIYHRRPAQAVAFPALFYHYATDYAAEPCRPGVRALRLTVEIVADDSDVLDRVEDALRALLDEATSELDTDNWACRRCRLVRSAQDPAPRVDPSSQEPLFATRTRWAVRLYAK